MRILRAAALAAALAFAPSVAAAVPQTGQPAPDLTLPRVDRGTVSLAALRGHPVYVNFFASWCGPCNVEAPSIRALARKYARRVIVLGVDELDAPGRGAAFVKKYGNPYTIAAVDDAGTVGHGYGAIALPVHVFIDRNGIVRLYRLGEMNAAQIEAGIRLIGG